jgi:DNA (cytosine-5)-methyltransferase 1
MKKIFKVASFFSGCVGMDLGTIGDFKFLNKKYKKHPAEIVFSTDFDKAICDLYRINFNHINICDDIRKIESRSIPKHDILTGGFPCQSFSVVAQNPKRLGYKDDKGKLFFELCRILEDKKPQVFIAENVKGLLSANKGEAFPLILEEFQKAGYHTKYSVLNASHFGVPQKRERVFIVGFRNKKRAEIFSFPKPITGKILPKLSEVIIDESEIDHKYYFSDKAVAGLKKTKNSKLMNKGRAQNINEPCNTVTAHLAKVSLNSTDPVLNINGKYRMFTPLEVARIQSFPDNYELVESRKTNYIALGNAVPPVLMWHVINEVLITLNN